MCLARSLCWRAMLRICRESLKRGTYPGAATGDRLRRRHPGLSDDRAQVRPARQALCLLPSLRRPATVQCTCWCGWFRELCSHSKRRRPRRAGDVYLFVIISCVVYPISGRWALRPQVCRAGNVMLACPQCFSWVRHARWTMTAEHVVTMQFLVGC